MGSGGGGGGALVGCRLKFSYFVGSRLKFSVSCEQRLHFRCVSWRAKSIRCRQPFNFLSRNSSRDSQTKLIVRSVVKWRGFRGNKKIATTLICYARLTQTSKPVKNRKNPGFFTFIRPDFWTDLNGCRQRLLFARQVTQRKCSLCSEGKLSQLISKNVC